MTKRDIFVRHIPNRTDWVSTSGSGSDAPFVVGPGEPKPWNPGTCCRVSWFDFTCIME